MIKTDDLNKALTIIVRIDGDEKRFNRLMCGYFKDRNIVNIRPSLSYEAKAIYLRGELTKSMYSKEKSVLVIDADDDYTLSVFQLIVTNKQVSERALRKGVSRKAYEAFSIRSRCLNEDYVDVILFHEHKWKKIYYNGMINVCG